MLTDVQVVTFTFPLKPCSQSCIVIAGQTGLSVNIMTVLPTFKHSRKGLLLSLRRARDMRSKSIRKQRTIRCASLASSTSDIVALQRPGFFTKDQTRQEALLILYFHCMSLSSPANPALSTCMGTMPHRTGQQDENATMTFFFDSGFLSCELTSCIFLKAVIEGDLTGKLGSSRIP